MKKFLIALSVVVMAGSCGSNDAKKAGDEKSKGGTAADTELVSNPVYQKGKELTERFMCLSCHKVDETLTGPAYRDVANTYKNADEATISKLAKKIIDGGAGVWGEVPMSPHPNVSEEQAKEMVQYILLLKK